MKNMMSALVIGLIVSSTAFAQEPQPETEASPTTKGPSIFVDNPEYDFGTVDVESIDHTFIIKNVGDETLEISNARPSCGCTVANITDKSIEPGGQSELTAKLSLKGRKGHQSKTITISSNDPEKPQYRIALVGNVQQAIDVNPDRLIYGQVAPGQETTLAIQLSGATEKDYQVLKIETNNDDLIATVENPNPGRSHNISVTLNAPDTVGPINGVVRITTDHPDRAMIDVPVVANVVGELVYAPTEISIPADAGDSPLTRYIVVRKGTVEAFEISEVITPNESITTKIYPFGDQGFRVQIDNIVVTDELNGKQIRILTSAEKMNELTVPFVVR